eukprot:gene8390-9965_t
MYSDLASSALRVYLTHLLQQTEEVSQSCRFQMSINPVRAYSDDKNLWKLANDAADEASTSIKDCQLSTSHNVGALCIVETLQDALREALYRARIKDMNDQQFHGRIAAVHAFRAKYLTYGFAARDRNDRELSSLWFLAAKNLYDRVELNYDLAATETFCMQSTTHFKKAASTEADKTSSPHHERAGHHYRLAAALSALGRPHSHDYVAELYLNASSACSKVLQMKHYKMQDLSRAGKLALLERVGASWLLAAEMAATLANSSNNLRYDPAIQAVVSAAQRCAGEEYKVTLMVKTMDTHKEAVAATKDTLTKCRDATMLPLWQDLVSKLEEATIRAGLCYQRFINGDLDADAATKAISEALETPGACTATLHELQLCHTKAAYYKQQAMQTRLSPFEKKCWAQAAAYMDDVARMLLAYIDAGSPRGYEDKQSRLRIFRRSLADDYPDAPRMVSSYRQDSKAVIELEAEIKHFVGTAEYLHLAYKHRQLPDAETKQSGTRVAVQYERVAELMLLKEKGADFAPVRKLTDQHLAFIGMLKGTEVVTKIDIAVRERIFEYGSSALAASDSAVRQLWMKSNDLLSRSVEDGLSIETARTGDAAARLYACAAGAVEDERRLCFESAARVCDECFCFGENPTQRDDSSDEEEEEAEYPFKLSLYHSVLAGTVLTLGEVTSGLPPELVTYFEQAQQQSAEDEDLKSTAAEHATYIVLRNRCVQQCAGLHESDATFDAWKAVQREVDGLLVLLHQRAEDVYEYYQTRLISLKVSFQALVVKGQVALAQAPSNSSSVVAWTEAVEICQNAAPKGATSAKVYENAVAAAERAGHAAQAKIEQLAAKCFA